MSDNDDDLGIARAVRNGSLGALLASDVPIDVQPQHWPRRDRLRATCGSYGQTVCVESSVTCAACRAALARRAARRELCAGRRCPTDRGDRG